MSVYVRLSSKSRKIGRVRELKDYILDPKKTRPEYCHSLGMDIENAYEDVKFVKQLYCQTEGRQILHWVVSCDKGVDAETANKVGKEVLQLLDGKYQALCATHLNTANYHTHFMINPVDLKSGNKFNESKSDMLKFRNQINTILQKYNLLPIGELEYLQDEEWDSNYEYADSFCEGELRNALDEVVYECYDHITNQTCNTNAEVCGSEDYSGHPIWAKTWINAELFGSFNPGTYAIQTSMEGNIFEGSIEVTDNKVFMPGIVRKTDALMSNNHQDELIGGVTYDDTPDNQFEVSQYVHGEKFSGRGNCENGKLLVPGILYSES